MTTMGRFFQIGFNRAGTTAIADMLSRQGLTTVHHTYLRDNEHLNVALLMEKNISNGQKALFGLDHIEAFTDIELVTENKIVQGNQFFREISVEYPEMKFILNIRRKADWINSRLHFGDYVDRYAAYYGIGKDEVIEVWSQEWDTHINAVQRHFSSERLLIFDIDKPDVPSINQFFQAEIGSSFRQRNKSANGYFAKWAQQVLPKGIAAVVPNRLKNFLKDY